jgi:protein SCO1/2
MPRHRIIVLAAAAFALLVVGVAVVVTAIAGRQPVTTTTGVADIGGPFSLVDDRGVRVTEADLAGKPYAMFFGFTFCPEVCPTTLSELALAIRELGPDADKLNYVFVTVDPERDTEAVMHAYVSAFDERIRGFTGTPEEIAAIAEAYKASYERVELEGGDYTMNHSAGVYLMNADNEFAGMISYEERPEDALAKLRRLAAGEGSI